MARRTIRFWPRWFSLRSQNWLCIALFVGWCIGQLFLDRTWLTGLAFYIPSPVLLVGLLTTVARNFCSPREHALARPTEDTSEKPANASPRYMGRMLGVAALSVFLVVLFCENNFFHRGTGSGDDTHAQTLVHWNVCSGHLGWAKVRKTLNRQQADIYVLSEHPDPDRVNAWIENELGSSFRAEWFYKMVVIAKGQIINPNWVVNNQDSLIGHFQWEYGGTRTTVFVVDFVSDLDKHRDPILAELNRLIREHKPDIVVGDFNAPRRSNQLQTSQLPSGYRHAYDLAGGEHGYTWPVPLPVYAIDQCLVGPNIQLFNYDLQTSYSDHRLQRLEFEKFGGALR